MIDEKDGKNQIFVKSHVARDFLQNAALFKTEKLVIWEYVSNGLQYIENGEKPIVWVYVDNKRKYISIKDNGRGMDWKGLQNFFIMHGENIDRKAGHPGRGMFGTGKSAAFGIGGLLRITSVRNGNKSIIQLSRDDIKAMNSEDPIPVQTIKREEECSEENGTFIEISDIYLGSLNQKEVVKYIERHLAKWRNARVFVNDWECEFSEPQVSYEKEFKPDDDLRSIIGDVILKIRIATAPLEEDSRGVSIFSNGVWHETTLAGNEGREMSQYIFGEIDVPNLDTDKSPIAPFDLSRSMRLNENNDLVRTIFGFIGHNIDTVRRELVDEEKRRKSSEEVKRLSKEAEKIANLINSDFIDFRQRIAKVKALGGEGLDRYHGSMNGGFKEDDLIFGNELPAEVVDESGGPGSKGTRSRDGDLPRELEPAVEPLENAEKKGRPAGGESNRPRTRGGFSVEFKPMGEAEKRAKYVTDERKIYVNLDHPQLVSARKGSTIEDPAFKRLSYEIAFTEYSFALAVELGKRGESSFEDAIYNIRATVDRISRKAASLFSI